MEAMSRGALPDAENPTVGAFCYDLEAEMTIQAKEDMGFNEAAEIARKLAVLVKVGLADERTVDVELGSSVEVLLDVVAAERGCRIEDLIVVREGEDEPLSATILIDADYPRHRRHHVHHRGEVKVTVYYQSEFHDRDFKRHATVEDVLTWAIKLFNIDPSMATEFELARHGQTEELPGTEHVGHLAGHHHELALDLVRGNIANGRS
jgi:hypothetical protein